MRVTTLSVVVESFDIGRDRPSSGGPPSPGDPASRPAGSEPPSGDVTFAERLSVPWWWYVVGLFCAVLLAGEFRLSDYPLTSWIPFVIVLPLSVVAVWSFGRARVTVADGELHVRDATLPLSVISRVATLDARTLPRVVGRHGDPSAYVFVRAWTHGGVQIVLDDPEDPTPYWIISSRRPKELAAALQPRS